MCGATRPRRVKIRGCLSPLQSWARFCFPFLRPRVDHPYTFPLITRWNHPASHARLPTSLEDIGLLLDQQFEAHFQWTPYEDPVIRAVIPEEFLQNPKAWHAKVALINYTTVEMHQFWSKYIEMWEDRYAYIPNREPIIVLELACVSEYMQWFRIYDKPYLLSSEERQR
ncbi:hypothetical protein Gotur_023810 [Gossypium turneri]